MKNLQEKYENFFREACYAFCLVKKFNPKASDAEIARYALDGLECGFIEDDGYVSHPVQFVNFITNEDECISVKKVDYKKDELTEDKNIVMWKYEDDIQFVIMNKDGDIVWNPSGNSNTVKYGVPVSIRRFITKQNVDDELMKK